jgi:protease-4
MSREKWIVGGLITLLCIAIIVASGVGGKSKAKGIKPSESLTSSKDGVAVVYLYEPIEIGSKTPFGGAGGAEEIIDYFKALEKDSRVKAVVLRINSPGGTVGASQELYQAINRYKKKTKVPVIVSIADIGASGAYWTAMAGDYIFANSGSMVGSIGVIMSSYDFSEIQKRYGIGYRTYKSVAHKDLLSSWRKPTDEEIRIINTMLQDIQEQFVETVAASRKLPKEDVTKLADGRVYTGRQALAVKLIDKIGTFDDAVNYAAKQAKIPGEPELITPESSPIQYFWNFWKTEANLPQQIRYQTGMLH